MSRDRAASRRRRRSLGQRSLAELDPSLPLSRLPVPAGDRRGLATLLTVCACVARGKRGREARCAALSLWERPPQPDSGPAARAAPAAAAPRYERRGRGRARQRVKRGGAGASGAGPWPPASVRRERLSAPPPRGRRRRLAAAGPPPGWARAGLSGARRAPKRQTQ